MSSASIRTSCCVLGACAALAAAPRASAAETTLTERLRLEGVYTHQTPLANPDDFALQGIPELSLLARSKRAQMRATYVLAVAGHTSLPGSVANQLTLASSFDVSRYTTWLVGGDATYATITDTLILRAPNAAPTGVVPAINTRTFIGHANEQSMTILGPGVRFDQQLDFLYTRTFDPPLIEGYVGTGIFGVDRAYARDALGVDARGGFASTKVDPTAPDHQIPIGATPHWRHDVSRTVSTVFAAGAMYVFSPDANTRKLVEPLLTGVVTYFQDPTTFELAGSWGPQPSPLTAQLIEAENVTFRASAPISRSHPTINGAMTASYTHGQTFELRRDRPQQPDFDMILTDIAAIWSLGPRVDLYLRYQFLDQIIATQAGIVTPDAVRNAIIVGVQFSSAPDPTKVPTRLPTRVDNGDGIGTAATDDQAAPTVKPPPGTPGARPQPAQPDQPDRPTDLPVQSDQPDQGGL